jgi:hypothetical protein
MGVGSDLAAGSTVHIRLEAVFGALENASQQKVFREHLTRRHHGFDESEFRKHSLALSRFFIGGILECTLFANAN